METKATSASQNSVMLALYFQPVMAQPRQPGNTVETQEKKQTDLTTDFTLDPLPSFFLLFFAQTQSLLSFSALCNHMSALLTFSKVFKKKNVRSQCQFLTGFLFVLFLTSVSEMRLKLIV